MGPFPMVLVRATQNQEGSRFIIPGLLGLLACFGAGVCLL